MKEYIKPEVEVVVINDVEEVLLITGGSGSGEHVRKPWD